MKIMLVLFAALSFMAFAPQPSFADIRSELAAGKSVGEVLRSAAGEAPSNDRVRTVVSELVRADADPIEVIRLCCSYGYDVDSAITGAVEGGAKIDSVVKASLESSCKADLMDALKKAGLGPDQIASAMLRGGDTHGYTDPGGQGGGIPGGGAGGGPITPGGGGSGGRDLSPNR